MNLKFMVIIRAEKKKSVQKKTEMKGVKKTTFYCSPKCKVLNDLISVLSINELDLTADFEAVLEGTYDFEELRLSLDSSQFDTNTFNEIAGLVVDEKLSKEEKILLFKEKLYLAKQRMALDYQKKHKRLDDGAINVVLVHKGRDCEFVHKVIDELKEKDIKTCPHKAQLIEMAVERHNLDQPLCAHYRVGISWSEESERERASAVSEAPDYQVVLEEEYTPSLSRMPLSASQGLSMLVENQQKKREAKPQITIIPVLKKIKV
jgi:hypothetical protein